MIGGRAWVQDTFRNFTADCSTVDFFFFFLEEGAFLKEHEVLGWSASTQGEGKSDSRT